MTNSDELSPRARAKRDQIRAGAQRLFLSSGFAGASTDAIAAAAGVSKQTLYAYYPSKEALLVDVLGQLIGRDRERIAADDGDGLTTPAQVRQALTLLAEDIIADIMQPDYLAMVRVVVAETPRVPALGSLFAATVPERMLSRVTAILERGRDGGVVPPLDTDAAARLFVGALLTYAILDGLLIGDAPPQPPTPEQMAAVVDLFMRMMGDG